MSRNRLSQFEDHVRRLIEDGFSRLLAGRLHPREVAVQLAKAMEDHARVEGDSQVAPDQYTVRLNPDDHEAILNAQPDLADLLAQELIEIARIADLTLFSFPDVKLLADEDVNLHQIEVDAWHTRPQHETTQALSVQQPREAIPVTAPKAMLIVNGDRQVPIDRPILNIGRHRSNHVILDDPRVSRQHAQIRLRFNRYVLFDLGSVAGTLVNNQQTQEAVLKSGDVITIADVSLIYIEEEGSARDGPDDALDDTEPHAPV